MDDGASAREQVAEHLTEAYRKARRGYGFFASLLIAWELLGVRLDPTVIPSVNVKLLTPTAAPYFLIALILYFAYRTSIEWYQCDARRSVWGVYRTDFAVSHFIGVAAVAIYIVQRITDIQIADPASRPTLLGFILVASGSCSLVLAALRSPPLHSNALIVAAVLLGGILFCAATFVWPDWRAVVAAIALGAFVAFAFMGFVRAVGAFRFGSSPDTPRR